MVKCIELETFGKLLGYFLPYFSLFKNYNTHTCSAHLFLFWYDPVPPEKILLPWEIVPDGEYHIPLDLLARRKKKIENHWLVKFFHLTTWKLRPREWQELPSLQFICNMSTFGIWSSSFQCYSLSFLIPQNCLCGMDCVFNDSREHNKKKRMINLRGIP